MISEEKKNKIKSSLKNTKERRKNQIITIVKTKIYMELTGYGIFLVFIIVIIWFFLLSFVFFKEDFILFFFSSDIMGLTGS